MRGKAAAVIWFLQSKQAFATPFRGAWKAG